MKSGGDGSRGRAGSLVCAALLAYLNSLRGAFQFDDFRVIVENPAVHSFSAWRAGGGGIRPLLKASYALNWSLGHEPLGFHLVNVALHAGCAVLLYHILRRVPGSGDARDPGMGKVAYFVALLWTLHPVQTEAVTYLSGRSVSLMAVFYLGSLLAYLKGRESGVEWLRRGLSPLLFLLAFLVKETAVTLPVALALWEFTASKQRRPIRGPLVHWILLGALLILMALHAGYSRLLTFGFEHRSLADNLRSQIHAVSWLLGQLAWPRFLNIDPELPIFHEWTTTLGVEAALMLAGLAVAYWGSMRRPWLTFGVLWAFLHLLPTNSLVPRLDLANERQLYLASAGLIFAVVAELRPILRLRSVQAMAWGLALGLGLLTVRRNMDYRTEITLWESSLRAEPKNPRALNNLGTAYGLSGQYEKAAQAYREALRLKPEYELPRRNLDELQAGGWLR